MNPTHETNTYGSTQPPRSGDGPRLVAWLALRLADETPVLSAQETLAALSDQAQLTPRDRGLALEIMQGVLRHRRLLDATVLCLQGFENSVFDPAMADVLRIGVFQHLFLDRIPPHALVSETVEVARKRLGKVPSGFANAVLQGLLRRFPIAADAQPMIRRLKPDVRHSVPGFLLRLLKRTVGLDDLEAALEAINKPLPLYTRVNPLLTSVEEVVEALQHEDITAQARDDLAPYCIEISAPAGRLVATDTFRSGHLFIQDASAQLVCAMAAARPGMEVVDLCAAPGGKTLALAAAMHGEGKLFACDISSKRLERLEENIARLNAGAFIGIRHLADPARDIPGLRSQLNNGKGADLVLIDAPCTGLGTLRRHPEIRWRISNADLNRLSILQGEILDRAATLVRPGGRLVYSTCSLAEEENGRVIDTFLERTKDAFLIQRKEMLTEDVPNSLKKRINENGLLAPQPHTDEMDSARAVVMVKK